ncbi:hypothetical protein GCM10027169_02840 [Gordonia jinhuaensis]|uniref:Uncharacterized protein n=1 Tax=Gordonia jinhuaensis TaxID=1517702 RepID=A0A916T303_9ACTN|nr:outer membrane porin GjpA [Gordonia jinhuaensis]GGB28865.1 hypothetical protein GCM10011489_16380 [Gordonia jinhuaensis]
MHRSPSVAADVKESHRRPLITTGAALLGAGAVALMPAMNTAVAATATPAPVASTTEWQPLASYVNALNNTSKNASTLLDNFLLAPGLPLQQIILNQSRYLNQVLNDPSSLNTVLDQISKNFTSVITGVTLIGADKDTTDAVTTHSVDGLHNLLLQQIPGLLPSGGALDPDLVKSVLNVLASPVSGMLMGLVGPVVSPAVAILNSAFAIAAAIGAGDAGAAFADVWDTPANVINAFFNGATLNLDALAPILNDSGALGTGTTINALDIAFGGLLSTGAIGRDKYEMGGNVGNIQAPGGSIFNSIGMNVTTDALGFPITLNIPGQGIGPIGAMEGLAQTVGALLGDQWDGKNGKPVPPLAGIQFPTLTTPTGGADVVSALHDWLSSIVTDTGSTASEGSTETGTPADDTAAATTAARSDATPAAPVSTAVQAVSAVSTTSESAPVESAPASTPAPSTPVTSEQTAAPAGATASDSAPATEAASSDATPAPDTPATTDASSASTSSPSTSSDTAPSTAASSDTKSDSTSGASTADTSASTSAVSTAAA